MRSYQWIGFIALWLFTATTESEELVYQQQSLGVDGEKWTLSIPAGMHLELLTDELKGARLMHFLPNGDLLIGSRADKIYLLAPPYSKPRVLVRLDGYPHSIAYRDGELLIARTDGVYHTPYKLGQQRIDANRVKLLAPLPDSGGHNSRTVAIGPDQRVYLALGISGNCSDEYLHDSYPFNKRRGGVLVLDESSSKPRWLTFASGLRNPVGFDWHPVSKILYASNNGPDHLGYEQPPEIFSQLRPGSFHGMPWFQYNGKKIQRDDCISSNPPREQQAIPIPAATFPARNAPMGVTFVPTNALDKRFVNNAIVALKGSWGTQPSGGYFGDKATRRSPRIVMLRFIDENVVDVVDVISGFQQRNGARLARPVGVAIGPDGALYFTSDTHTQGLFRLAPSK